ncbi:MAG: hypothetical protein MI739_03500 [Bacteroidales bacterium]|nr:hypothetical protein [Bacteroidales bacterium]
MFISFTSISLTNLIVGTLGDVVGLVNTYTISSALAFFAIPFILILRKRIDKTQV